MEPIFALMLLKRLVRNDQFYLVKRKAKHASPVTKELAKIIVKDLSIHDFIKSEKDRSFPDEYVWIYEATFGIKYYIKFKFEKNNTLAVFISFHEALYIREEKIMTYIADYTNSYDIRGHEISITAPAKFDDETHQVIHDLELDNQAAKMALAKFRRIYKVVSPQQIKDLRKKWHLSQRKLAQVLGWSPSTVALYETGAIPTNGNNRLLKVLIKDDGVMKEFIEDSKKIEM